MLSDRSIKPTVFRLYFIFVYIPHVLYVPVINVCYAVHLQAAGLATMISTMRPDIDNMDEYVRNTTARAFAVVASALGIPSLLPFLKVRSLVTLVKGGLYSCLKNFKQKIRL